MSLFRPANLVCPSCGTLVVMDAVGSVNADRRPDLRQDILDNRFQDVTCGTCSKSFRLQPEFNYLDVGHGQWIAAMPAPRMPDHLALADQMTDLFAQSYGHRAPKAAQEVGQGLAVRLTFGWPALREKLMIAGAGMDDAVVEMIKLDLIRRLPSAPISATVELRLVRVTDDILVFDWVDRTTEGSVGEIVLPRAAHDEIAAEAAAWAGIRARLLDGPFVDMLKLIMGPGRDAAPTPAERVLETEG